MKDNITSVERAEARPSAGLTDPTPLDVTQIDLGPDAYIRVWRSGDYTIIHTVAGGSQTTVSLDSHQAWRMMPAPEPNPEWEAKADAAHAAIVAEVGGDGEAADTLRMLETWKAHAQPADADGRISFTRAMLDSAEDTIRALIDRASSEEQSLSPSEASTGNPATDEPITPPSNLSGEAGTRIPRSPEAPPLVNYELIHSATPVSPYTVEQFAEYNAAVTRFAEMVVRLNADAGVTGASVDLHRVFTEPSDHLVGWTKTSRSEGA